MILLCRNQSPPPTSQPPPNTSQPSTCRLLSLPAEIRVSIWELLLIHPETSTPPTDASFPSTLPLISIHNSTRFCANILLTCKQAHHEGTPILYGRNLFAAHSSLLTHLPSFLLRVRPYTLMLPPVTSARAAARIHSFYVHVRLDTDPRFSRAQCTAAFAGCARLEVDVFQASYGTCDFGVLALFEGVRGVKCATVTGSVGDGKYADWLALEMMREEGDEGGERFEKEKGWDAWTRGNR